MTQHYPKSTTGVSMFCPTCNEKTMHDVHDGRVGSCRKAHVEGPSKAQAKTQKDADDSQGVLEL